MSDNNSFTSHFIELRSRLIKSIINEQYQKQVNSNILSIVIVKLS